MQVLALNGSPRLEASNSQAMLAPLLAGMEEAGAQVSHHYLAKMDIGYCTGCFSCWLRTPGKCILRDDMDMLLPEVAAADYIVLSFPLYVYTLPALVKTFLERLLPTAEPWLVPHPTKPELTTHPRRNKRTPPKLVVLSSAGLFERSHFSTLITTLEHLSLASGMELAGLILRTAGGMLQAPPLQEAMAPYFAGLKQAGGELVRENQISAQTLAALDAEYLPVTAQQFNAQANAMFSAILAKNGLDATPPLDAPLPPVG